MNSLAELNGHGIDNAAYNDQRVPSVTFNPSTPSNQALDVNQGATHSIPVGTDITGIINYAATAISYSIDISTVSGATITWEAIPIGCVVSNPSTGVYKITGINSVATWNIVKHPIVTIPVDFINDFTYTCTIQYITTQIKTWDVSINIIPFEVLSTPVDCPYIAGVNGITGYPQIYDYTPGNATIQWTISITPSSTAYVTTLASGGSGGTSTFNPTTRVLTIVGTKSQVNSHLGSLILTTPVPLTVGFSLTYYASNASDARTKSVEHHIVNSEFGYLSTVTPMNYSEDVPFTLTGVPLITDYFGNASGMYTYTITPSTTSAVRNATFAGTGGTISFNATTRAVEISGNKSQVNNRLAQITIIPSADYTSDFLLNYAVVTPENRSVSKSQNIYCTATHEELSNIIGRAYDNDLASIDIFATSTPQITDLDPLAAHYTIELSTPIGKFGTTIANAVSNYTYSGTKAQVNAALSTMKFVPNTGVYSTDVVTFHLLKDGVMFVNTSFVLTGPWTPTFPKASGSATSATITEGATRTVPFQIDIIGPVIGSNATFNIDLRNCPGATITNGALSGDVVRYTYGNATNGYQYGFENINTVAEWNSIKASCLVNLPNAYSGSFSYTVTLLRSIQSGFIGSYSWTDTLTVTDVYPLTAINSVFNYFSNTGTVHNLSSAGFTPTLADSGNQNPTWTVTVTPEYANAISSWTIGGSGGTASVNATTKVVTLTGTIAQINSRLANLSFNSITGIDIDFVVTYNASNDTTTETGTRSFTAKGINENYLALTRATESFSTGVLTDITNGPLITDTGVGGKTLTIADNSTSEAWTIELPTYNFISTTQKKFGTASLKLLSSNCWSPGYNNNNIGSGNFTVEMWLYPETGNGAGTGIINSRYFNGAATGTWGIQANFSTGVIIFWDLQNVVNITSSVTTITTLNTWHHLACVRSGSTVTIYFDGTNVGSGTMSTNFNSQEPYRLGDWDSSGGNEYKGYVDDLHVTRDARYTANFTPPTAAHIPDANTLVYLPFEEANGANVTYNKAYTTSVVTSYKKNSSGSVSVNNNYMYTAGSTDWRWYDTDYTVEAWVNIPKYTGSSGTGSDVSFMVGQMNATSVTNYWSIGPNINGKLAFYWFSTGTNLLQSSGTIPLNTWTHIAVTFVKSTKTIKMWINGVLDTTYVENGIPTFDNAIPLTIGAYNNAKFVGFIDDLQISNSVRYTANFTPSTTTLVGDTNTKLLLTGEGVNGSAPVDVSTAQSGVGTYTMKITAPNTTNTQLTAYTAYLGVINTGDITTNANVQRYFTVISGNGDVILSGGATSNAIYAYRISTGTYVAVATDWRAGETLTQGEYNSLPAISYDGTVVAYQSTTFTTTNPIRYTMVAVSNIFGTKSVVSCYEYAYETIEGICKNPRFISNTKFITTKIDSISTTIRYTLGTWTIGSGTLTLGNIFPVFNTSPNYPSSIIKEYIVRAIPISSTSIIVYGYLELSICNLSGNDWVVQQTIDNTRTYVKCELSSDGTRISALVSGGSLRVYDLIGGTWTLTNSSVSITGVNNIAIDPSGTLVAFTFNSDTTRRICKVTANGLDVALDVAIPASTPPVQAFSQSGTLFANRTTTIPTKYALVAWEDTIPWTNSSLTYSGTKTAVNSQTDRLRLQSSNATTFDLFYEATTPSGQVALRNQKTIKQ